MNIALIGWLPASMNPIRAGVRFRCLTPQRVLRKCGVPIEIYAARRAPPYQLIIAQDWAFFATSTNTKDQYCDELVNSILNQVHGGTRLVLDFCDNPFFNPKRNAAIDRGILRLATLSPHACEIVCGSEYLAQVVREQLSLIAPIRIIEDPVEKSPFEIPSDASPLRWFSPTRHHAWVEYLLFRRKILRLKDEGRMLLVWFGNHGTNYADGGMGDLTRIRDLLHDLNQEYPLSLSVISNHSAKYEQLVQGWHFPTQYLNWDRLNFNKALRLHDIAIIPIEANPFTLAKGNNRVALALSQGLAVVADAIPSYEAFAHCAALDNWENGLRAYLQNPDARRNAIAMGEAIIEQKYTETAIAKDWLTMIQQNANI